MANVNVTGFQRHRREQAQRKLNEAVNEYAENKEVEPGENKLEHEVIDILSADELKDQLDLLGVKYSHNTSEGKLRDKLKEAIKGVE